MNTISFPVYFETFGDVKNPCLILINGIGGQLIHWPSKLIADLINQDFFVVIFDHRDVGLSQYYDHLETPGIFAALKAKQEGKIFYPPYTLCDMAYDVIRLMNKLNIQNAHIAGFSMGGMIAQILALEYSSRIKSVIYIATSTGDSHLPPTTPEVMAFFFSPKKEFEDLETYVSIRTELYKIYNHPDYFNEEETREFHRQAYERAYHPEGFKRQLLAIITSEPRGALLQQVQIPSLIIHGDYDPAFPLEHGKFLASSLPNSQLEIIKKMGHGIPGQMINQIVPLIRTFLNKSY